VDRSSAGDDTAGTDGDTEDGWKGKSRAGFSRSLETSISLPRSRPQAVVSSDRLVEQELDPFLLEFLREVCHDSALTFLLADSAEYLTNLDSGRIGEDTNTFGQLFSGTSRHCANSEWDRC
jgi:hypothetical protein